MKIAPSTIHAAHFSRISPFSYIQGLRAWLRYASIKSDEFVRERRKSNGSSRITPNRPDQSYCHPFCPRLPRRSVAGRRREAYAGTCPLSDLTLRCSTRTQVAALNIPIQCTPATIPPIALSHCPHHQHRAASRW